MQVDLHVDRTVTPAAQSHRRIPFIVRPKLETAWEKLIGDDVIERVEGSISWVSPVVIRPNRTADKIRLNVDMREANKAIPQTHIIILLSRISHMSSMEQLFSPIWI